MAAASVHRAHAGLGRESDLYGRADKRTRLRQSDQAARDDKSPRDEGYTFVQTTHYPRHAKFVSSLTLFIKDGEILAFGRSEQLINAENIDKIDSINYEKYEDRL